MFNPFDKSKQEKKYASDAITREVRKLQQYLTTAKDPEEKKGIQDLLEKMMGIQEDLQKGDMSSYKKWSEGG